MNPEINRSGHLRHHGFTLIEALIAVVVLATGMLALTALQAALMRSSADSKARSQLATFAQSELDTRRVGGYGGDGLTLGTTTTIATPADDNPLGEVAKSMGSSSVQERITVTQFVASADGAFPTTGCTDSACVTTALAGRQDAAQYKRVDLTLSWADVTSTSRNRVLSMSTVISPLALNAGNILVDRPPPVQSGLRPIVRRPLPVPVDTMIPLALGDNGETAATNPKPELVGAADNSYAADTRFDVLTYNTAGNQFDNVRFDKRIETAFVGCRCKADLSGFPTSGGGGDPFNGFLKAMSFRPSYWDGSRYTNPVEAGVAVRGPDPAANQSALCDVCCRDHRDPGVAGPQFNPWISQHNHYLVASGDPVSDGTGSQTFLEACRVIRVDGLWRVTPDPLVDDIALLATRVYPSTEGGTIAPANNNRATQYLVSSDATSKYINYIYEFLKQKFFPPTGSNKKSVVRLTLQKEQGLDVPDYIPVGLVDSDGYNEVPGTADRDVRWLHARGLLVDFLEDDAITRINRAITDCGTQSQPQCVLPYLPIVTINVTELAQWAGKAVSETGIDGTNLFPGVVLNYGQALIDRFASAIARVGAIAPVPADYPPLKDEQTFALIAGLTPSAPTWLKLASVSGLPFGDQTTPTRGSATVAGAVNFSVTLNGFSCIGDKTCTQKPKVSVVESSGPNTCNFPYSACDAASAAAVTLQLELYNRQLPHAKQDDKIAVCNVSIQPDKCETHTFDRATVDGLPVSATWVVKSGLGTPEEKGEFGTFTLTEIGAADYPSSVIMYFNEQVVSATAVCQVGGTGVDSWTCP